MVLALEYEREKELEAAIVVAHITPQAHLVSLGGELPHKVTQHEVGHALAPELGHGKDAGYTVVLSVATTAMV